MSETVGKIEQLTGAGATKIFIQEGPNGKTVVRYNDSWKDPKSMAPRCAALWEWYKTLADRIKIAQYEESDYELDAIRKEIEAHAVEIEYQCRI